MIRLWLSRDTEIPMQEQLTAQLVLGILSRRLAPGERLPSVRGLARRLALHPNTVSAVYQDLARRGWVSSRHGSGVFVRHLELPKEDGLDALVRGCLEEALARGFAIAEVSASFERQAVAFAAERFAVIDPDAELAEILATEIGEAMGREIPFAGCDEAEGLLTPGTCALLTEASLTRVGAAIAGHRIIRLKSMQDFLVGLQRPSGPVLIAVCSRSEAVLGWAWKLLSALGFSRDAVLLRNASDANWKDGLTQCDIVAVDLVTAPELEGVMGAVVIRMVADEFLGEMRGQVS